MHTSIRRTLPRLAGLSLSALLLLQPALAAGQPAVPQGWTCPFSDAAQGD